LTNGAGLGAAEKAEARDAQLSYCGVARGVLAAEPVLSSRARLRPPLLETEMVRGIDRIERESEDAADGLCGERNNSGCALVLVRVGWIGSWSGRNDPGIDIGRSMLQPQHLPMVRLRWKNDFVRTVMNEVWDQVTQLGSDMPESWGKCCRSGNNRFVAAISTCTERRTYSLPDD